MPLFWARFRAVYSSVASLVRWRINAFSVFFSAFLLIIPVYAAEGEVSPPQTATTQESVSSPLPPPASLENTAPSSTLPTETTAPTPVAPPKAAPSTISLFSSTEKVFTDMSKVGKWTSVMERIKSEEKQGAQCEGKEFNSCKYKEWDKFIDSIRKLEPAAQLTAVNKQMNRSRYTLDNANWGQEDYWATPGQFLARSGDCEDYALAKYMTLRKLGWPAEKMRLVVVQDLNLNVGHAILVVYVDDKILVLDNQIPNVVDSTRIRHYRPIYSVNEEMWWRHIVSKS